MSWLFTKNVFKVHGACLTNRSWLMMKWS